MYFKTNIRQQLTKPNYKSGFKINNFKKNLQEN